MGTAAICAVAFEVGAFTAPSYLERHLISARPRPPIWSGSLAHLFCEYTYLVNGEYTYRVRGLTYFGGGVSHGGGRCPLVGAKDVI